jgi:hypothetical protein
MLHSAKWSIYIVIYIYIICKMYVHIIRNNMHMCKAHIQAHMDAYTHCIVRVCLPGQLVLQARFGAKVRAR